MICEGDVVGHLPRGTTKDVSYFLKCDENVRSKEEDVTGEVDLA